MSCYEWEEGTISLSVKGFAKVRAALVVNLNASNDKAFDKAGRIAESCKAQKASNRRKWVLEQYDYSEEGYTAMNEIFRGASETRPCKPRSKAYPKIANRGSISCSEGELSVNLDAGNRTLSWHVSENNHAVKTAVESSLGRAVLTVLNGHTWGRNEGGVVRYSSEYSREHLSSSGDSISRWWGPVGYSEHMGDFGLPKQHRQSYEAYMRNQQRPTGRLRGW